MGTVQLTPKVQWMGGKKHTHPRLPADGPVKPGRHQNHNTLAYAISLALALSMSLAPAQSLALALSFSLALALALIPFFMNRYSYLFDCPSSRMFDVFDRNSPWV